MGMKEIELDLDKSKNNITLLLGSNGSGKTFILSQLNPYRISNDNRREIILEGEKGYKEIHYSKGDIKYIIKHHYGPNSGNNKSFISKNGKELNENGGIRLADKLIEDELDVSKDYFTVGRLGDNVSNFIDYSTTERKKYINKFIPNIDEYLEAFNIVREDFNDIRKKLKSINVELDKYPEFESIVKMRDDTDDSIKEYKRELDNKKSERSSLSTKENIITEDMKKIIDDNDIEYNGDFGYSIDQLKNMIVRIDKEIEESHRLIESHENLKNYDLAEAKEKKSSLEISLVKAENKLDNNSSEITRMKRELSEKKNFIGNTERRISSLKLYNTSELENRLVEYKNNLDNIENDIKNMKDKLLKDINEDILDSILSDSTYISKTKDGINSLLYKLSNIHTFREESDLKEKVDISKISSIYTDLNNKLLKKKDELNKLDKDYINIIKNEGLLDILDASENHEHRDECVFVPMALGFKENEYSNIGGIEKSIADTKKEIHDIEESMKININNKEFMSKLIEIEESNNKLDDLSYDDDKLIKSVVNLGNESEIEFYFNTLINDMTSYKYSNEEKNTLMDKIERLQESINNNNSNHEIVNDYKSQIEENTQTSIKLTSDIEKLEKELVQYTSVQKKININMDLLDKYIDNLTNHNKRIDTKDKLNETLDNLTSNYDKLNSILYEYNQTEQNINKIEESIVILEDRLNHFNNQYTIVKHNIDKIEEIEKVYPKYSLVYEALDPKTGIPLIFIDTYLKDIAVRTNELLSIAYNNSFFIDFEVSDTEFAIKVYKSDGTVLSDIADASQGEKNMTNISLSLSLLEKITEGYNILYLDEVDATLDDNNRKKFISVIEKQIENLGIEQTFVISHNNEFLSSDIDFILLNGYEDKIDIDDADIMQGKNVVFNINEKNQVTT